MSAYSNAQKKPKIDYQESDEDDDLLLEVLYSINKNIS